MAVTGPDRLALHAAARGALGPEEGGTLVASLPPANTDITTRQELERARTGPRRDLESRAAAIMQALERRATTAKKHRVAGHGATG